MFSGIFSPFIKICFSLSTSFYLNQNNSIISVCIGIISVSPCFALLVCFDPFVCFIWTSEVILGSLPLFPKTRPAEKLSDLLQLLILWFQFCSFNYKNMPGTRYMWCNLVNNTLFQICILHLFSIQIIALHLIEINGLLFFTSSERIKYSLQRKMCFRNEDSSAANASTLLSYRGGGGGGGTTRSVYTGFFTHL